VERGARRLYLPEDRQHIRRECVRRRPVSFHTPGLDKRAISSLMAQLIVTGIGHEDHVGTDREERLWPND
jgi:hypothetical protein